MVQLTFSPFFSQLNRPLINYYLDFLEYQIFQQDLAGLSLPFLQMVQEVQEAQQQKFLVHLYDLLKIFIF